MISACLIADAASDCVTAPPDELLLLLLVEVVVVAPPLELPCVEDPVVWLVVVEPVLWLVVVVPPVLIVPGPLAEPVVDLPVLDIPPCLPFALVPVAGLVLLLVRAFLLISSPDGAGACGVLACAPASSGSRSDRVSVRLVFLIFLIKKVSKYGFLLIGIGSYYVISQENVKATYANQMPIYQYKEERQKRR